MNILHELPFWTYGGVETFISTLSNYSRNKHFFRARKKSKMAPIPHESLREYTHNSNSDFDVMHYHHAGLKSGAFPSVFTVHNIYPDGLPDEDGHSVMVAVSDDAMEYARREADYVDVIPPAIDLELFNPVLSAAENQSANTLDKKLGFDGRPIVLWCGRICPGKRPELLAEIIRLGRSFNFLIVGDDYIEGGMNRVPKDVLNALSAENVRRISYVHHEDMPKLYHLADVVISTSKMEGFGLTIAEAMACGTPVVVPNVPSLNSLVGDGAYGMIARGGASSFVEAIDANANALFERGRFELRMNRVKGIMKLGVDAKEVAARYDEVYEEAAG